MLVEVSCDAFKSHGKTREKIKFHKGLNTIVGGRRGTNSIGKSTFLMILDFAFGGENYTVENINDIKEVGPHLIKFAFQDHQGKYCYYSRSTETSRDVNVCDEKYEIDHVIPLKQFRKDLLRIYGITIPDVTFRGMVTNFIRVHPLAPSKLIELPLQAASGQPQSQQIDNFEKLFDSYREINNLKIVYDELKNRSKALLSASKYDYVRPAKNKTTYNHNDERIKQLKDQIETLKEENAKGLLDSKVEQNNLTRELIQEINRQRDRKSHILSQIAAVKRNQGIKTKVKKQYYEPLQVFFPDLNTKYLDQVENFHLKLSKILDNEIKEALKELQDQLDIVDQTIRAIESKVKKVNSTPSVNMLLVEKISRYNLEIQNLQNANSLYDRKNKMNQDKKESKQRWDQAVEKELNTTQQDINNEMRELNTEVCGSDKVYSPVLNIKDGNHYSFTTSADTGTGSEYKGLILFDIACLKLSELPFIIHDSLLFTNIEMDRVENIIKLYSRLQKQVFISIDRTEELDPEVQEIIKQHQVLKLDRGENELFGRTWSLEEKKED